MMNHWPIIKELSMTRLLISSTCEGALAGVINLLENYNVDVNATDIHRQTALQWAAQRNHPEIVRVLLRAGASVNHRCSAGFTPLHDAAREGNIEIVGLLLEAGARVDLMNKFGWTPLRSAAEHGHTETVKLLLQYGVSPFRELDYSGQTIGTLRRAVKSLFQTRKPSSEVPRLTLLAAAAVPDGIGV
jgi:ankyrin repeat protein